MLRREYHSGIARVNASKFYVFADSIFNDFAVVGYCVKLYFFGFLHKLRNNHRIFLAYFACHLQESLQFFFVVANIHCSTREHIRWTNQYRIAHAVNKFLNVVHACQRAPLRLVDAELVEHSRELIAVLCTVDWNRRCTKNGHTLTVQFHCQVVWNLTTHRHYHASWHFKVDYIEHAFEWKLVEVQAVAHIIVGRYSFWVIVNHNALVAKLASRLNSIYRAPVKFNRRSDAISAWTKHYHRLFVAVIVYIITFYRICHI